MPTVVQPVAPNTVDRNPRGRIIRYLREHVAAFEKPAILIEIAMGVRMKNADTFEILSQLETEGVAQFAAGHGVSGGWRLRKAAR